MSLEHFFYTILNSYPTLRSVSLYKLGKTVLIEKSVAFKRESVSFLIKMGLAEDEYMLMISAMADFDPKMSANIAVIATITFFTSFQLNFPNPLSQNVNISIAIGINKPRIEKQKAPIRDTNGIIVGTATAIQTHPTVMTVRKTIWATVGLFGKFFFKFDHAMSIQT